MAPLSGLLSASLMFIGLEGALSRLDVIDLPLGFFPEGITNGEGWTAYVGSLASGNIWKGDLETGEGEEIQLAAPGPAVGLDHDRRSGYLFVAGGPSGTARVYDKDFGLVADLAFASDGEDSFVNDVIITKTAAYFTDSFNPRFYKVPLDRDTGDLEDGYNFSTIPLSDSFSFVEEAFNVNGIEATDDGSKLIIVSTATRQLYAVDPSTGDVTLIDLGGELLPGTGSDGLVLRKNTLWVIDNALEQVIEVSLSTDLSCGVISPVVLTNPVFDRPTTAMRKGNSLYTVSAKFDVPTEDVPTTSYEIARVDRDNGELACEAE